MNTISKNQFENISLKVRSYKCFGDEPQGFDKICPINIIIGRNNAGKSTLLELVQYAVNPSPQFQDLKHRGKGSPEVLISQILQEPELQKVFPKGTHGGVIPGNDHWTYGSKWIGQKITYSLDGEGKKKFIDLSMPFESEKIQQGYNQKLADATPTAFSGKVFKRLLAERDIIPDKAGDSMNLGQDGSLATNILRRFITITRLPQELVEEEILTELNKIFNPDSDYQGITTRQAQEGAVWEIFLQEADKGRIPLSHTGSGFKTILLVLMFLYLVPRIEDKPLHEYVFAFEELENNVHPALQRRLLLYLREFVINNECILFLTTHSNIAIDMFSRDNQAQIVHVTHDREKADVRCAQTYIDNKGILDDLDIRASDLLQANSVVWVEGPSDRLYVNKWIDIWTKGTLKEGVHYQCIFYGGRLLAHLSADNPELQAQDAVNILRLNKNAFIVMDSDKRKLRDRINHTKKRITEEIKRMGGFVWITQGREVENYLPTEAMAKLYEKTELPALDKFEDFAEYLYKNIGADERKKFVNGKPQFAANICPLLTKENSDVLDWSDKLNQLCCKIQDWNRIPLQTAH